MAQYNFTDPLYEEEKKITLFYKVASARHLRMCREYRGDMNLTPELDQQQVKNEPSVRDYYSHVDEIILDNPE